METLEDLKAIIANAPFDATNFACSMPVKYLKLDRKDEWYEAVTRGCDGYLWELVDSNGIGFYPSIRCLSDIGRIIELMELNQNMHTTVAGYIYGKDWAHWNEFNAGKFKL